MVCPGVLHTASDPVQVGCLGGNKKSQWESPQKCRGWWNCSREFFWDLSPMQSLFWDYFKTFSALMWQLEVEVIESDGAESPIVLMLQHVRKQLALTFLPVFSLKFPDISANVKWWKSQKSSWLIRCNEHVLIIFTYLS